MISIIIVNWNGRKWLNKCLGSLSEQTYKKFELIVVDNGSTDDSVSFIENNFPKTIIIKNKNNTGFAYGNNVGIKKAKGELMLLINNDAWIEKDFLENLLSYYKKNKYDVVSPREAKYTGEKQETYSTKIDFLGHPVYLLGDKHKKDKPFYLPGVCLLFSKKLYEQTGGLDNNFFMYCEEVDWFWRLSLLNKKFCFVNNVFINHAGLGSTNAGIDYNRFLWRNQNTLQMLLKNYKWYTLFWIIPIYILQNIIEIIFFLIILKPKISFSYIQGWWFNILNFDKITARRTWVQKNRKLGDLEIIGKMYLGFGKFKHLVNFLNQSYKYA